MSQILINDYLKQLDIIKKVSGSSREALLRADPASGSIALDSETTLRGIPAEAWTYKLGNRCAIDWVLDQYKEKNPRTPPSARSSTPTVSPITRKRSSTCWGA